MENKKNVVKENTKKEVKNNKKVDVKKKEYTTKDIIIACLIIIIVILLGIYIFKVTSNRNKGKIENSYLLSTGTVRLVIDDLDDVSQTLSEAPTEYFVLITYTNDEATYNLENGLKKIIDDYKLNTSFFYLNIKDYMNDDDYLQKLNTTFNTDKITKVPIILYYKNGTLIDTVKRDDNNVINAGDFQRLLDIYEYEG